jgi:squalene-hopene/tetraprenyl-beta-curcumene cyclase
MSDIRGMDPHRLIVGATCRAAAILGIVSALVLALVDPSFAQAPNNAAKLPPELRAETQKAIDKGLAYLARAQEKDGGWTANYGPAVSAIVGQAFAQDAAHGPQHPIVQRTLASILRHEQADGGIYDRKQNLANYQTSVVLMFLASLPKDATGQRVAMAQAFLTKLQYDDSEKHNQSDTWYGGAGYDGKKRPDLSNTQMMLEALHQSGLSKDDPVYQRALVFVSRSQMNEKTNDQTFARGATDGGFIYTPCDGGVSKANEGAFETVGPPRSYGSMTYAGFKSMLYAGVTKDDPRIVACLEWIKQHYTLNENPNLPGKRSHEGLYYYYHVFARALFAWGEPVITDGGGKPHNWRMELCRKIISLQRPDGSWLNERDRWLEGDANYVTGLTIRTLQTAMGD